MADGDAIDSALLDESRLVARECMLGAGGGMVGDVCFGESTTGISMTLDGVKGEIDPGSFEPRGGTPALNAAS